MRRKTTRMLKI